MDGILIDRVWTQRASGKRHGVIHVQPEAVEWNSIVEPLDLVFPVIHARRDEKVDICADACPEHAVIVLAILVAIPDERLRCESAIVNFVLIAGVVGVRRIYVGIENRKVVLPIGVYLV
jgi:hypothetical protein